MASQGPGQMDQEDTSHHHDQNTANPGTSQAWSKVIGCFLIYTNTWGMTTSFGAYQSYYQLQLLSSYSASTISWIGTTQVFLFFFISIVSGPLFDSGYSTSLLYVGCFLNVFSLFMLSIAHEFYQILLAQGVCFGIGSGLLFVPAVTAVSNAFDTLRPLALGLAATGSALGGIIFPIIFRKLITVLGLAWTNRVFGFLQLAAAVPAIVLLTWPTSCAHRASSMAAQRGKLLFDFRAFREPPFSFLCAGLFFVELGFWIPPFTIAPYAQLSLGSGVEYSYYLLAIMNGGSFAGRVLPALAAQIRKVGPGWVLVTGCVILGGLVLVWISIHDIAGITVWSVCVGFMSGIAVSVPNAVLPEISPAQTGGSRSGMMWAIVAFAALIGSPLAGLLVDPDSGSYHNGQLFSGLSICLGAALLCVPAVHMSRKKMD